MSNIIIEPLKNILGLTDTLDLIAIVLIVTIFFTARSRRKRRHYNGDI